VNDWKPNYRTKPGVEIMARREQLCWRVLPIDDEMSSGALFGRSEFDALFEPIPRPRMVEIPLETAMNIKTTWADPDSPEGFAATALLAAIRAAEQEQTP
jgi:hypothetical protein